LVVRRTEFFAELIQGAGEAEAEAAAAVGFERGSGGGSVVAEGGANSRMERMWPPSGLKRAMSDVRWVKDMPRKRF